MPIDRDALAVACDMLLSSGLPEDFVRAVASIASDEVVRANFANKDTWASMDTETCACLGWDSLLDPVYLWADGEVKYSTHSHAPDCFFLNLRMAVDPGFKQCIINEDHRLAIRSDKARNSTRAKGRFSKKAK